MMSSSKELDHVTAPGQTRPPHSCLTDSKINPSSLHILPHSCLSIYVLITAASECIGDFTQVKTTSRGKFSFESIYQPIHWHAIDWMDESKGKTPVSWALQFIPHSKISRYCCPCMSFKLSKVLFIDTNRAMQETTNSTGAI